MCVRVFVVKCFLFFEGVLVSVHNQRLAAHAKHVISKRLAAHTLAVHAQHVISKRFAAHALAVHVKHVLSKRLAAHTKHEDSYSGLPLMPTLGVHSQTQGESGRDALECIVYISRQLTRGSTNEKTKMT